MKESRRSILEAIGRTPIIRLNRVAEGVDSPIYVKCEFMNPGGSIKDRVGIAMVEDAERRGLLYPGGTIIEATSGNTGVGLALAAAAKGYGLVFVMPDKMSAEKIRTLRAFGATVVVTPTDVAPDDPESYYSVARRLAQEMPNSFFTNQYSNPANPEAHYRTTGPEIWEQTGGEIDALVVGMGTGGTISGCGRYLKEQNSKIKLIGVDPEGSIYYDQFKYNRRVEARPYKIEGIGEDFIPGTINLGIIDDVIRVADKESFLMTRRLLAEEGIFAGISSGAAVAGALRYARRLRRPRQILVILPDSGNRYLSKVWDDAWMSEAGFLETPQARVIDVLKVVATQSKESNGRPAEIITAVLGEPIDCVIAKMREHAISQLPVIHRGEVVGMICENDLIQPLLAGSKRPTDPIDDLIEQAYRAVSPGDSIDVLPEIFSHGSTALVVHNGALCGVVTKIDLISYMSAMGA
jgi:cystathionine beta-synthase